MPMGCGVGRVTALIEPEVIPQLRGKFKMTYAMGRDRYQRSKGIRLMDLNTVHALVGESHYFDDIQEGEFCVVDVVLQEKAWFEWLPELEVLDVGKLIERHFGYSSFQVGPRLWFV
jgi:hypothetical protein